MPDLPALPAARELPMATGVLIAESLRVGTVLDDLPLLVRKIQRSASGNATADQPPVWTLISFDVADAQAEALSARLSEVLDESGWYVDLHTAEESLIAFPGRVFRYPRGDPAGPHRSRGARPRPGHTRLPTRLADLTAMRVGSHGDSDGERAVPPIRHHGRTS
ncbi:hypothetical protein FRAAL3675 [Frankia alni ACN14a]|uniref:Uncharacterized protein n=2 Tax=Frankiaceae TaxID=74712 RepID=Q0RJJ4_FRAAA|nr:hypothetical protein FRAAL3675 [Frankia alni ACN14a]